MPHENQQVKPDDACDGAMFGARVPGRVGQRSPAKSKNGNHDTEIQNQTVVALSLLYYQSAQRVNQIG